MTVEQLRAIARYVTDPQGNTEVFLPIEVWESLLKDLQLFADQQAVDPEMDSNEKILEDLKESVCLAQAGKTFPISELWDEISV